MSSIKHEDVLHLVRPNAPTDVDNNYEFDIKSSNLIDTWNFTPYPELSVLLVKLRYLALIHQTHHWIAKGDSFYGDHLMFERLYTNIVKEIDAVAEKVIGLASPDNVNLKLQCAQLAAMSNDYVSLHSTLPSSSKLAHSSLMVEKEFLKCLEKLVECLNTNGTMTRGLDNLIAGLADTHESHVFLLNQRVKLP